MVKIWSWADSQPFVETGSINAPGPIECLHLLSPFLFAGVQGAPLVSGAGSIKVWQMQTGMEQVLEGGHAGTVHCLDTEISQGFLFSGGDDSGTGNASACTVKLWKFSAETNQFAPITQFSGHQNIIQDMKTTGTSPEVTDLLITADRGGTVAVWGVGASNASTEPLHVLNTGHTAILTGIWVDGKVLFTAGLDGHVRVWDCGKLAPGHNAEIQPEYDHVVLQQDRNASGVVALAVVPHGDESVMVTACSDKALKLWMMPTFGRRGILTAKAGHAEVVRCIAKGPGNSFFTGSMSPENGICVWEFP